MRNQEYNVLKYSNGKYRRPNVYKIILNEEN